MFLIYIRTTDIARENCERLNFQIDRSKHKRNFDNYFNGLKSTLIVLILNSHMCCHMYAAKVFIFQEIYIAMT